MSVTHRTRQIHTNHLNKMSRESMGRNWKPFENVIPGCRGRYVKPDSLRITPHRTRKEIDGVTVRVGVGLAEKLGWKIGDSLLPVQCDDAVAIVANIDGWKMHAAYASRGTAVEHRGQIRNLVAYLVLPVDVRKRYCPNDRLVDWTYNIETVGGENYLVLAGS